MRKFLVALLVICFCAASAYAETPAVIAKYNTWAMMYNYTLADENNTSESNGILTIDCGDAKIAFASNKSEYDTVRVTVSSDDRFILPAICAVMALDCDIDSYVQAYGFIVADYLNALSDSPQLGMGFGNSFYKISKENNVITFTVGKR